MQTNLYDSVNLLSKFTVRKFINATKVLSSYYISKATKKVFHSGLPIAVAIEPTTSCNLRCPQCPSGLRSFTRPTGIMEIQFYKKTIDQLKDSLLYLTLYFQGEPYLNPQFLEMVQYASDNNIYTSTSTNAHYLSSDKARNTVLSGLDRLIISLDGFSQESYEKYRIGGVQNKVIEGIKNVVEWKRKLKSKTPYVVLQFLVMKQNQHEIEEIKKLSKQLKVDYLSLKTAQIYDFVNGSELLTDLPEYSRYAKSEKGEYNIKNNLLNTCWKMWHSCVITWNGSIVPCCFDKDASYTLGSMENVDFSQVWKNDKYKSFRQNLLTTRKEIEICKNCSEGTKVFA